MKGIGLAAAIVTLISAILELIFAVISLIGTITSVLMLSGVMPATGSDPAEPWIVFGVYLTLFVLVSIAGALHLMASIALLRNKPNPVLLWAAVGASILPVCSCYCAITSIPAGILMLLYLVLPQNDGPDPDILV